MMKEWLFSGPLLIVSYNLFPDQSTELREQESLSSPHPKYTYGKHSLLLFWAMLSENLGKQIGKLPYLYCAP